jgi:hypothetical protein
MIVKYTVKEVKSFAAASSVAQEVLQNIRTTTAFHGQEKEEKRFRMIYSVLLPFFIHLDLQIISSNQKQLE